MRRYAPVAAVGALALLVPAAGAAAQHHPHTDGVARVLRRRRSPGGAS